MYYIHYFDTKASHDDVYNGDAYNEPWVAKIEETLEVTYDKSKYINGYVRDGLILYLDGLDKGPDEDCWTNLMDVDNKFYNIAGTNLTSYSQTTVKLNDGYSMTLNGVTVNNNSIEFTSNTANSGLVGLKNGNVYIPYAPYSAGTIEFCGDMNWKNASQIIIYTNSSGGASGGNMMLAFSPQSSVNAIAYFRNAGSVNNAFVIPNGVTLPTKITISLHDDFFMMNAQKYVANKKHANWSTGLASGVNTRFYGGLSNSFISFGKYHSIRIYNRKLTEEEMMINQLNDIARFGL